MSIRVLVIDDSALVRSILTQGLNQDRFIEVVGTAADPYIARDKIVELNPDVLTLDVEMPRMDGVEFLRKLMPQFPIPTIMVSSLTERGKQITMDALEAGAIDFVSKPKANLANQLSLMMNELCVKVKSASKADVSHLKGKKIVKTKKLETSAALAESTDKIIVIGASTGGTEAIKDVVRAFPVSTPGVVITQHMPAGFTKMFANRLNDVCDMAVKEADDGDRVMNGRILVAPGDKHMEIVRSGGIYKVKLTDGELVCGHRPSVEVMMNSIAKNVGTNAVGAMLTGMGKDGAGGMKAMRDKGARCFAQDEATSVVFGMPKEAYKAGGAEKLLPLSSIASALIKALED